MLTPLYQSLSPLGWRRSVAAFSPASIAGLKLWLKADSLALNDRDPVATWTDSSGSGHDATQATALARPVYRSTLGPNGKPAVQFDEASLYLTAALALTQPYTVFVVGKTSASGANQYFLDGSTLNTGVISGPDSSHLRLYAGGLINAVATPANYNIIAGIFNGAAPNSSLSVNGVKTTGGGGASNTSGMTIGAAGNLTNWLGGFISEVIAYDSSISDVNRSLVEGYLDAKYPIF